MISIRSSTKILMTFDSYNLNDGQKRGLVPAFDMRQNKSILCSKKELNFDLLLKLT